jgi:hypothetical protein
VLIATAAVHQTARQMEERKNFVIMAVKDTARRMMKLKNDEERHAMEVLHQVALTLGVPVLRGKLSTYLPITNGRLLASCRFTLVCKKQVPGEEMMNRLRK